MKKDKMTAYWVLYYALNTATLVMSPVIPFMTEHIWQNFTRKSYAFGTDLRASLRLAEADRGI